MFFSGYTEIADNTYILLMISFHTETKKYKAATSWLVQCTQSVVTVACNRKEVMPGGVVNVLSSLVYIGIFVWLTKSVYFGPYQRYLNNDTKIVEDWADPDGNKIYIFRSKYTYNGHHHCRCCLDLNGTQYPTVVFCKLPGYRNENPFLREAIEDQVTDIKQSKSFVSFFVTWQIMMTIKVTTISSPQQRILNNFTGYVNYQYLNRASEVLRGLLFMDNVQEIASTIDPDEVFRPVLSDCRRFGRCFAAETKDLIAQADHLKDTDEPAILTFTLVFDYEGINRTDISTFPLYIVYFMDSVSVKDLGNFM